MKNLVYLFMLVVLMMACNENKKVTPDEEPLTENSDTTDRMYSRDDVIRERDNVLTDEEGVTAIQPADYPLAGRYKLITEDPTHDCSYLAISFTTPTRLCITPDEIFIFARYEKTGSNTANVYLDDPLENHEGELPWEEFDRDTPIATLNMEPNGTLVLDWKGFAVNGDIATDYAIYGKKTLEGTYERQQ